MGHWSIQGEVVLNLHAVIKDAFEFVLAKQNRPLPVTLQETMGGTYLYNTTSIKNFLSGVSKRLAQDVPAFKFDPRSLKPADCVAARVVDLLEMIAENTETM